jgi:pseudaminic acid synthase
MKSAAEFAIADRRIGLGHAPYVICELSANHNGSLDQALKLMDAGAATGCHAIKIQTYTPDTITIDCDRPEFMIKGGLWDGYKLHDLYKEATTPYEWHAALFAHAHKLGVTLFSTPFDETALELLIKLDAPAYKIASFENNHLPLIRKVVATGKPVIMSTGMASLAEIDEAVRTAREAGCRDLVLLKCTSTYPASPDNSNVLTIPHMRQMFGCEIGLSDHTMGIGVSVAAVAHGATVIEKHFTLSRADGGVDSAFSLEPAELALLVTETERAWRSLGHVTYGPTEAELKSLVFRRSLYIVRDMKAGEVLTQDNLRVIRPGLGLHPRYYERMLGRHVTRNVKKGEPLAWSIV